MDYFNADGHSASLCLNGTRCAAQLAFELGWSEVDLEVETAARTIQAHRESPTSIGLELSGPKLVPSKLAVDVDGRAIEGWVVEVGVPHFVIPQTGPMQSAPVQELGPALRRHQAFGDRGTNVNFVRYPSPGEMELRTFERGVEAETLACGSGVIAAAAVGFSLNTSFLPITSLTKGGFHLIADRLSVSESQETWYLLGDARVLSAGSMRNEAELTPQRPNWDEIR
jgi:diaminopimelate epimerase